MPELARDEALDAVALLADPVRRDLYQFIAGEPDGAGRDAAAAGVGVSRPLAAFHLDRLVAGGLLEASFRRLGARRGPGAGRPAKIYRRTPSDIVVSLPERHYDVAGELLATAFETALKGADSADGPASDRIANALDAAARELGRGLGVEARRRAGPRPGRARLLQAALDVLAERGYEPAASGDEIVLRNCPFDALALRHRAVVCGMNFSIMGGLVEGLRGAGITTRLEPMAGRCCVVWGRPTG